MDHTVSYTHTHTLVYTHTRTQTCSSQALLALSLATVSSQSLQRHLQEFDHPTTSSQKEAVLRFHNRKVPCLKAPRQQFLFHLSWERSLFQNRDAVLHRWAPCRRRGPGFGLCHKRRRSRSLVVVLKLLTVPEKVDTQSQLLERGTRGGVFSPTLLHDLVNLKGTFRKAHLYFSSLTVLTACDFKVHLKWKKAVFWKEKVDGPTSGGQPSGCGSLLPDFSSSLRW